ncbi:MAG: hypothetical protein WCF19_02615 [Chlamydiales bacterium]
MKRFAIILATVATLSSNGAFAQSNKQMGSGAQAGTMMTTNKFAWEIGLTALILVGLVAGLSAGAAASTPSTFSH